MFKYDFYQANKIIEIKASKFLPQNDFITESIIAQLTEYMN